MLSRFRIRVTSGMVRTGWQWKGVLEQRRLQLYGSTRVSVILFPTLSFFHVKSFILLKGGKSTDQNVYHIYLRVGWGGVGL